MRFHKNTIKEKMKRQETAIGSWLNIPSPEVTEMMLQAAFEFLVIDMEHASFDTRTMQQTIMLIEAYGKIPFVRVEANDPVAIKKALDAGAYGIIVPMINSLQDAQQAVSSVYYPIDGRRGVGLSRAQGYGSDFARYREWYEENVVLIVQIEHREAFNQLEQILSVPQIDGSMIGPYDLSGSFGRPGDFQCDEVQRSLREYEEISKKVNKPLGAHIVQPVSEELEAKIAKGYQFLAYGIDEIFIQTKCREESAKIQKILNCQKS